MMKDILALVCIVTISITMFVVIVTFVPQHGVIMLDCSIAEISPDYSPAMKEECRRARSRLNT